MDRAKGSEDSRPHLFKKKTEDTVDSEFFSDDVPFDKYTHQKILKGKYSYNLNGFAHAKTKTSIDRDQRLESRFQPKFLKPPFQQNGSSNGSFHWPGNLKNITNMNQTLTEGSYPVRDANLVQSSYDFQEYPAKRVDKAAKSSNDLSVDPMKTKIIAMRTNPAQAVQSGGSKPKGLQRHYSVYNLNAPGRVGKADHAQMALIMNNLRRRKESTKLEKSFQKSKSFKKSGSTQNLIFQDYKPFQLKSTTIDSRDDPGRRGPAELKPVNAIKKSRRDKQLQSQYTVSESTPLDKQTVKNVFYQNKYTTAVPAKKAYKTHSKSMSIHGNLFGKNEKQLLQQRHVPESTGRTRPDNPQTSPAPPRTWVSSKRRCCARTRAPPICPERGWSATSCSSRARRRRRGRLRRTRLSRASDASTKSPRKSPIWPGAA